jgi:hypothetical protein
METPTKPEPPNELIAGLAKTKTESSIARLRTVVEKMKQKIPTLYANKPEKLKRKQEAYDDYTTELNAAEQIINSLDLSIEEDRSEMVQLAETIKVFYNQLKARISKHLNAFEFPVYGGRRTRKRKYTRKYK